MITANLISSSADVDIVFMICCIVKGKQGDSISGEKGKLEDGVFHLVKEFHGELAGIMEVGS